MNPTTLLPLTAARAVTSWTLDVPAIVFVGLSTAAYLLVRRQGDRSPKELALFGFGMASLLVVTCSFLGVYSHTLFWVLAVQDVLLLTLVPIPLVLALSSGWSLSPLAGSVLATGTLTAVYATGWDRARLEHSSLFALTHLLLVVAGCLFLGPLLQPHGSSFAARALIGFVDGLLDAIPGLVVLASHGVIAASWYAAHPRHWGPSVSQDQQIGGTAMIALSELVGLPALLILLLRWARADTVDAELVDAHLDRTLEVTDELQRPWWEHDAGPLADRVRRDSWSDDRAP